MSNYRLFLLDDDRHVVGRFEFHALDERDAECTADEVGEGPVKELWCDGRWLKTWATRRQA